MFDASRHRQTLAGTLGLRALCGVEERRIRQGKNHFTAKVHSICTHEKRFTSSACCKAEVKYCKLSTEKLCFYVLNSLCFVTLQNIS